MSDDPTRRSPQDASTHAMAAARAAFLDQAPRYGCAESAFVVLKAAYELRDPADSAAAMAFNGGIAWTGGSCGAVTGASLAIGMLADVRLADHGRAKLVSRELVADLMSRFSERFGSLDCRELVGMDLRAPGAHAAFIAAGTWRRSCLEQIQFVVGDLARLADEDAWTAAVEGAERDAPG